MLLIPALELPVSLPHPDAIQSTGANVHNYDPEFWELEYRTYRYLGRIANTDLALRHESIVKNMRALISDERDVIPLESFLSSWYWYRKEHQTRLEFFLRDAAIAPPSRESAALRQQAAPQRPKHPNAGDVLFRYGDRKYMSPMLRAGMIRIRPAADYKKMEMDRARFDEERAKRSFMPGDYVRVSTLDGREMPIRGDVSRSVSGPDYYMLCMSCDWNESLFGDFGADSCVVIKNSETFAERLQAATALILPGWYFHHNPVEYFDPHEMRRNQYFDAAMCKDFRFAYQREYRFLWMSPEGEEAQSCKDVELGSLDDIAELHRFERSSRQADTM